MNEELKALEDLINFIGSGEIADTAELCEYVAERKDLIETALKDYETRKTLIETIDSGEMIFEERNVWEEKQKKIKAFNTIKEKKVDIHYLLKCKTPDEYNKKIRWLGFRDDLVQEEFDQLKEVLLQEK